MLLTIQIVHSLIYLAALACIAGVWIYALTGALRRALPLCAGAPLLIGLGLVLNGGDCLFQSWARQLSGADGEAWVRDLLWLPEAVAVNTPLIFGPVFAAGMLLALQRWMRNR